MQFLFCFKEKVFFLQKSHNLDMVISVLNLVILAWDSLGINSALELVCGGHL